MIRKFTAYAVIVAILVLITPDLASAHGSGGAGGTHFGSGGHHGASGEPRRHLESHQTVPHTWCVEHPQACRIVRRR